MNNIALYNTLRKIPEVTDNEAKEAIANIASSKEVATKADLETGLIKQESFIKEAIVKQEGFIKETIVKQEGFIKEAIAKQEARLTWRMVVIGLAIVGIIKYL